MRINRNAFTLVELLAVIVILAIILAIAIPSITNIITNTEKSSFVSSTKLIINAVNIKLLEDETFDITTINKSNLKNILNIEDENYAFVLFRYDSNGKIYVVIEGEDKWDNLVTYGNYDSVVVSNSMVKEDLLLNLDAANTSSYPKTGTNWYDLSGNGINGNLANGVSFNVDNGGSIFFDGINDFVTLPNSFFMQSDSNPFTINIWFNSTQTSGGTIFGQQNTNNPSSATGFVPVIYLRSDGKIRVEPFWTNNASNAIISNKALNDGKWHLISTTFASGTNRLYIDGEYITKQTGIGQFSFSNNNYYYFIGAGYAIGRGLGTNYYSGKISGFQFYNRELSTSEIEQNFNAIKGRYGI